MNILCVTFFAPVLNCTFNSSDTTINCWSNARGLRMGSTTQGNWSHPQELFMHDEAPSATSMMSLSSAPTHTGLSLSVLHRLPGVSQCMQNVNLAAERGCGLLHINCTHSSITAQRHGLESKVQMHSLNTSNCCRIRLPENRPDTGAVPGTRAQQRGSYPNTTRSELCAWESSGNHLHSFHRCWLPKRNADFELICVFSNAASALNSHGMCNHTDRGLLQPPTCRNTTIQHHNY